MSDVLKFRGLPEIEEEAAAWVWRLDDETLAPEQRVAFEAWLRRDPRHRQAFEELGGVWGALDYLAEAKRDERIATFVAHERRLLSEAHAQPRAGRATRWMAAAAVVCLAATGAAAWLLRGGDESRMLATTVGQQHSEVLADGSKVQLNTNSLLETRFEPARRLVHLRKGEATFKVASDSERPFVVHAGNMVVRAIGTEFNVRLREGHALEVIVTEGRVAIEPWEGAPVANADTQPRQLVAGQRLAATAEAAPAVSEVAQSTISKTLAWREGAIVFDGEPLMDAIAELNRYTDHRMMVVDPALNGMRVGGRFRAGDIDGFLEGLTRALPVTTRRTPEGVVYIEAAGTSRQ